MDNTLDVAMVYHHLGQGRGAVLSLSIFEIAGTIVKRKNKEEKKEREKDRKVERS
jgi:hypothetical protein